MPAVNRWQLKLFIIAHKLFKNLSLQPHHPSVCRALCFLHHMNDHVEAQRHLWRVGAIVFVALKKWRTWRWSDLSEGHRATVSSESDPECVYFTTFYCSSLDHSPRVSLNTCSFCWESTAVTPHRKPCTAVTPESCCPLWLLSPSFPTCWSCLNFPIPSGFWLLPDKTRTPGMLWGFSEITEVKPFHGETGGWSGL